MKKIDRDKVCEELRGKLREYVYDGDFKVLNDCTESVNLTDSIVVKARNEYDWMYGPYGVMYINIKDPYVEHTSVNICYVIFKNLGKETFRVAFDKMLDRFIKEMETELDMIRK